jgi:hypothetical protein
MLKSSREEKCIQGSGTKTEGRDHWEDLGVARKILLKWILKKI